MLTGAAAPDGRSGPVIALPHAMDALSQVLDLEDKKAAEARAKEIAEGEWAADVVRASVKDRAERGVLRGAHGRAPGADRLRDGESLARA